jgi:hypothetical protein
MRKRASLGEEKGLKFVLLKPCKEKKHVSFRSQCYRLLSWINCRHPKLGVVLWLPIPLIIVHILHNSRHSNHLFFTEATSWEDWNCHVSLRILLMYVKISVIPNNTRRRVNKCFQVTIAINSKFNLHNQVKHKIILTQTLVMRCKSFLRTLQKFGSLRLAFLNDTY